MPAAGLPADSSAAGGTCRIALGHARRDGRDRSDPVSRRDPPARDARSRQGLSAARPPHHPSAPIAEKIDALELMVEGAGLIAARPRRRHPGGIAHQLVEMVVRAAARQRAADAIGEALAAQVRAREPLGSDQVMYDRAWRETHFAAARN